MCITSAAAKLANTTIYAGPGIHPDGYLVHVLGYQNKAKTLAGPNSMILPFPSKDEMVPGNVIDTSQHKSLLSDLVEACEPIKLSRGSRNLYSMYKSVQVFNSGRYTVVLAHKPTDVQEALKSVPENKRPVIYNELLTWYDKAYPGWPLAVCCFDSETEPEPMVWWYRPKDENFLFAPAMDSHTGGPPTETKVVRDHKIMMGSFQGSAEETIARTALAVRMHTARISPLKGFLDEKIKLTSLHGVMPNTDYYAKIGGTGQLLALSPPGLY